MNNLELDIGLRNEPGFFKVEVTPASFVSSFPDPVALSIDEITLKPGKIWYIMEFTSGSVDFESKSKNSIHGKYHELGVDGFHPKPSSEKLMLLDEMLQYEKFIIRAYDIEGNIRIIGTLDAPCDFEFDEIGGRIGGNRSKGYNIKFNTVSAQPALYMAEPPTGDTNLATVFYPDGVTVAASLGAGDTFIIPILSNSMFKKYRSDAAAIQVDGEPLQRKFEAFIDYDFENMFVLITGTGLVGDGSVSGLSAAKNIWTDWEPSTGIATFKNPGPAADNMILVAGYFDI